MSKISDLAGSSYKVQYNPEFSDTFKSAVANNVTASLIPNPDDSEQGKHGIFDVDQVYDFVDEVRVDEDLMQQYGFTEQDLKIADYIRKSLKVQYIEF